MTFDFYKQANKLLLLSIQEQFSPNFFGYILQFVGKVCFIDYEFTMVNYQAYDIANHFNEFVGEKI